MSEDLAPAIRYATEGFPVTEIVAEYWTRNWQAFAEQRGLIEEFANATKTFLVDGHTPRQGEVFRNPDLAHTLSLIAKNGRDAFYKGTIARTMADYSLQKDRVTPGTGAFGGYEAILYDAENHVYWGASEMRKDGEVIG